MIKNKTFCVLIVLLIIGGDSYSQVWSRATAKLVGGPCEGCEAIFEYGERNLMPIDTLPDFEDDGIRIKVTGTIFQADGETPVKDVIMYVYHTDQQGIYATQGGEAGWARRHGYLRGWVKTAKDGKYTFYTLKPGPYPGKSTPAHIHPTILEPNGKYYWLGAYHFAGDKYLTEKEASPKFPRGGSSGLLVLHKKGDLWTGTRDIILGKNIAGHE